MIALDVSMMTYRIPLHHLHSLAKNVECFLFHWKANFVCSSKFAKKKNGLTPHRKTIQHYIRQICSPGFTRDLP